MRAMPRPGCLIVAAGVALGCGNNSREAAPSDPPATSPARDAASADATTLDAKVAAPPPRVVSVGARLIARVAGATPAPPSCEDAHRASEAMITSGELASDWGPTTGASTSEATFEVCVNGHEPDAKRRRARLARYLAPSLALTEVRCRSTTSEEKSETAGTLDAARDLGRIDELLRDGQSITKCSSATTCEWSAPGATAIELAWKDGTIVALSWGPGTLIPCVPD